MKDKEILEGQQCLKHEGMTWKFLRWSCMEFFVCQNLDSLDLLLLYKQLKLTLQVLLYQAEKVK